MKQIGNQARELLSDSGMELLHDEGEHSEDCGVILKNTTNGDYELWVKNDRYAGYVIEIEGVGYEFIQTVEIPEPYIAESDADQGVFKAPSIGDCSPEGYELVDTLFVDNSGFGREGEPALTANQFLAEVKSGLGYAITGEGQFQVYVGVFKKKE